MELQLFDPAAILLVLASVFGLLNHHFIKLPFAIGMMVASLIASILVLALDLLAPGLGAAAVVHEALSNIDFAEALLQGMLGFLLFAGALHTDLDALRKQMGPILSLASVGLVISTTIVAVSSYLIFGLFGVQVPFIYCLVFGALISPTDPVAVLGIMRAAGAPKNIEVKIIGESLFNDGFAVVLFAVLMALAAGTGHGGDVGAVAVAELIAKEVFGGVGLGMIAGYVAFLGMRTLDEPNLEILISVSLVMGISFVAFQVHTSAPLACVVAGLLIGNRGRSFAMSERTSRDLDVVWSFIDEMLNAVLFLLIGLEVIAIPFEGMHLAAALILIPLSLFARFVAVAAPITAFSLRRTFREGARRVLTWGGLKGGISIALAMSLPEFEGRDAVLTATYAIVVFSIAVQGLTVGTVIEHLLVGTEGDSEDSGLAAEG